MNKKLGPKLSLSFKENIRDIKIYDFLVNEIKYEIGISSYVKKLVETDMERREMQNQQNIL